MHNRRKTKVDPERDAKLAKRAKQLMNLQTKALDMYHSGKLDEEALKLTEQVLSLNSDFYTLWNYRRKIIESLIASNPNDLDRLLAEEMRFTQQCVPSHPKSYHLWHHRRWTVARTKSYDAELRLCDKLLEADGRNFHCWRHRMWASCGAEETSSAALAYSEDKIGEDFSNYSAWHHRAVNLSIPKKPTDAQIPLDRLRDDLDFVKSAFYTEPEDQSAWIYHKWLVEKVVMHREHDDDAVKVILRDELAMCNELGSLEPDCKWPLVTTASLVAELKHVATNEERAKQAEVLKTLLTIDPMRKKLYEDLIAKAAV